MTGEMGAATTAESSGAKTSVLITITTPGANTPICRLGNSEALIADLTVRQLVERVISRNSLFSVGVPMTQLEAESSTALAIGELLSADCCEISAAGRGGADSPPVALDCSAREVAREQVGSQGSKFVNIALEVRSARDAAAPSGPERRRVSLPDSPASEQPLAASPAAAEPAIPASTSNEQAVPGTAPESAAAPQSRPAQPIQAPAAGGDILTIVAEAPEEEHSEEIPDRKEYVRKADWLRAQFLPEVQALDFSGLLVGNLGLGIREEKSRRDVVLADPSRITDVLLRANGYRRSGDHAKALICYQELVDMDAANADFRFLLAKTFASLGQHDEAIEGLTRAKELGHDGASKELEQLKRSGHRARSPLGFLKFWKQ